MGRRTLQIGVIVCASIAVLSSLLRPAGAADPRTLALWGESFYRAGELRQAWTAFMQAAVAAPGWARPALWLGAVAMARGDRQEAVSWFTEALRRHPSLEEESCAVAWLERLGVTVSRPRWRLATPKDYATFVHAVNPALTWGQALWLGSTLIASAARYRLDPRLLAAVVFIESRFNHQAVSPAGAEGLGQLMPGTAAGLGIDPRDPLQNLMGAAWLLRLDLDEFRTVPLALAAYNAGSGAVRRWQGIPPYAETQWYVWAVLWVYDGLRA
jgi:soluble lytic murein transglycosylase-like protein